MEIKYQEKYVAFIDVLGFSSLVETDSKEKLQNYFNVIKIAFQVFDEQKKEIKKCIISDSIILIANDSEDDFKLLLTAIRTLQSMLALSDIWVRGGIAFGSVYYDQQANIIVGKGFIKAYLLEKNHAIYPRVIIDPSILSKLNCNRTEFCAKFNNHDYLSLHNRNLIHNYQSSSPVYMQRTTPDDAIFVCYANQVIADSMLESKSSVEPGLNRVYDFIRANLYGPQQHYSKYLWLKKYFNDVLVELSSKWGDAREVEKTWLQEYKGKFLNL